MGVRFGAGMPKQYTTLGGRPVLSWILDALEANQRILRIIPVIREEDAKALKDVVAAGDYGKLSAPVIGGIERQDSVYNALKSIGKDEAAYVMVHDAVRPFLRQELITKCIEGIVEGYDGTVVAVPPKDTIKQAEGERVSATLERSTLWSVQTPQTFRTGALMKAYEQAMERGFYSTDDSALVEATGGRVRIVMGYYENIKITTPEDALLGDAIINKGFMEP